MKIYIDGKYYDEQNAKISWRRTIGRLFRVMVRFLRDLWPRRSRPNGDNPGLEGAGRLVPRKPTPPRHLVAAKGLPPSEKTYLFQKFEER